MFLTILTPSYNRAHTLIKLYQSLEKQSNKWFEWLIVDDGSDDGTNEYINEIKENASIEIRYIYKPNGGKHTAINEGINHIDTPLTFIVDSDDFLTDDAIETIFNTWEIYKNKTEIGSIWFLQSDSNGKIIGDYFPDNDFISSYIDVIINKEIKGDKRAVYLTKARKEFLFPTYKGEKFIGESIVHKRIGDKYKGVFINKVIYKGEYLEEGLSKSGKRMRIRNPLGGMDLSKEFLTRDVCFKVKSKKMILYLTYGFFASKKIKFMLEGLGTSRTKNNDLILQMGLFFLALPFAWCLHKYWGNKYQ
ncbi:glycosyltransferase family A protein [Paenibacillus sp. LjRoot56]|uniref:glycosyltransferase family A protein n=1 Tax=Paenibacillus sp. LjRoot56 TaxID=3342333 RepID=UPI003ECE4915